MKSSDTSYTVQMWIETAEHVFAYWKATDGNIPSAQGAARFCLCQINETYLSLPKMPSLQECSLPEQERIKALFTDVLIILQRRRPKQYDPRHCQLVDALFLQTLGQTYTMAEAFDFIERTLHKFALGKLYK